MGNTILEEVKNISDKQYIADMNTLNNVLIDASTVRESYNDFEITDYINTEHFKIEDKNAITTSTGNFTLDKENGKVTWNLDGLSSGTSATLTIDLYLKNEYIDQYNLYKTNTKEEVTSEINGIKENISKTDTPILSNSFTVSYDENAPDGCKVEGTLPESKQYSVFTPIKIEDTTLTCDGYKFQGWEAVNKENVSMIGNSYFVSDGNDIKLKAIWSKVSLNKSMDGTVYEANPVIKAVSYDAENQQIYQGEFWNDTYKYNTTKIVIQNALNPIEEAVEFWDVSEAGDRSVMAYAVLNDDGSTYTIYLQGNGKIIANENSSCLFFDFSKLQTIEGLEYLDTSKVTDMSYMFYWCENLIELDVSNLNTSKVTDMHDMFCYCSSLTELDLSNFDTSNVTDMYEMFCNCSSLKELNVSNFDTSNVTDMDGMFSACESLTELDVSSFDTSNVVYMNWMFWWCKSLTELDLSTFNTEKVINMGGMFGYCDNLTKLDVSSFDTSNVTDMRDMFTHCKSLIELDLSNFDTSSVIDMGNMFSTCSNLTELDISNFDTSNVTDMFAMFVLCENLTELNLSTFDTSKVETIHQMFQGCSNLKLIDFRNATFNNITSDADMFYKTSNLSVIVKDETARTWIQGKLGSNGTAIIAS